MHQFSERRLITVASLTGTAIYSGMSNYRTPMPSNGGGRSLLQRKERIHETPSYLHSDRQLALGRIDCTGRVRRRHARPANASDAYIDHDNDHHNACSTDGARPDVYRAAEPELRQRDGAQYARQRRHGVRVGLQSEREGGIGLCRRTTAEYGQYRHRFAI